MRSPPVGKALYYYRRIRTTKTQRHKEFFILDLQVLKNRKRYNGCIASRKKEGIKQC